MDRIEHLKNVIKVTLPKIPPPEGYGINLSVLRQHHQLKGFFEIYANNDIVKSKQEFYQYGLCFILDVTILESKLLYWAMDNTAYILLSDSRELIEKYGNLKSEHLEEHVTKGQTGIYTKIMQNFMINSYEEVAKNIKTIEEKILPKKSRKSEIPLYVFFKALLEKDKDKVSEYLKSLSTNKMQSLKMRNEPLFKKFTVFPALGFTKLAWQQEMEIEINSHFIPMEMMPIKPNAEYFNFYPNLELYLKN